MSGVDRSDLREGERSIDLPDRVDACVFFIGTIRTPWRERSACPRRGDLDGPVCRIECHERWREAFDGIEAHTHLDVLYWMHLARRDLVHQNPKRRGTLFGTFGLRSPNRPNPIAASTVALLGREGTTLLVRGLDCVDGTPLIDLKPARCPEWGG